VDVRTVNRLSTWRTHNE